MKLADKIEIEEQKTPAALRFGLVAGLPLLAGGAFFLYRKLKQEIPPAPAWDAELQRTPLDEKTIREESRPPAEPGTPSTETLPADRVEYTNEFGEKAVGMPGGGLDALPLTPVDETDLVPRFGNLIGMPITDLMDSTVGSVEAVYYRHLRGEPEWAAISLGMVDKRRVVVPLDGATFDEDKIRLAVPKSMIEEAPTVEDPVLGDELEKGLYAHYMVRRMLPGLEGERDEDGLRLRMWAPVATEMGESVGTGHPEKEAS